MSVHGVFVGIRQYDGMVLSIRQLFVHYEDNLSVPEECNAVWTSINEVLTVMGIVDKFTKTLVFRLYLTKLMDEFTAFEVDKYIDTRDARSLISIHGHTYLCKMLLTLSLDDNRQLKYYLSNYRDYEDKIYRNYGSTSPPLPSMKKILSNPFYTIELLGCINVLQKKHYLTNEQAGQLRILVHLNNKPLYKAYYYICQSSYRHDYEKAPEFVENRMLSMFCNILKSRK